MMNWIGRLAWMFLGLVALTIAGFTYVTIGIQMSGPFSWFVGWGIGTVALLAGAVWFYEGLRQ